jgi:hypothetical protein
MGCCMSVLSIFWDHSVIMFVVKQNKQNIDNSECFGVKYVKYVKMYPEMTSQ